MTGKPRLRGANTCLVKNWWGSIQDLCGLEAPAFQGGGERPWRRHRRGDDQPQGTNKPERETQMQALTLGAPEGAGEAGGGLSSDRSSAEWATLRGHAACWGCGDGPGRLPGGGDV